TRRVVSVTDGAGAVVKRADIRLTEMGVTEASLAVPTPPSFVMFSAGRKAYIASSEPDRVLVDGKRLPASGVVAGDSLTIGRGSAAITLRFRVERGTNRRLVLYDEHLASSRWRLDGDAAQRLFVVNASDSGHAAPGTLPLIDLADWPLGPRAADYAGVLQDTSGGWWWRHAGASSR